MPRVTRINSALTTWMPKRVPPEPWKTGFRTPSTSNGGGGTNRGGSLPSGGAGGSGGDGGGAGGRAAGATARAIGPPPGGEGLRKNDARSVRSRSFIPHDYRWKPGGES